MEDKKFNKESELCAEFIKVVPKEWMVYPETGGFDIVLVHQETGAQIGIEAKLRLNPKVLTQALPKLGRYSENEPDFRAILVPHGKKNDVAIIAAHMGISVLMLKERKGYISDKDGNRSLKYGLVGYEVSDLPETVDSKALWHYRGDNWVDWCPSNKIELPEVVPDTACGTPSPMILTPWKIKAIKLVILLDEFGLVTTKDFRDLDLNRGLWIQNRWLDFGEKRGTYLKNDRTPNVGAAHPKNYEEFKLTISDWLPANRSQPQQSAMKL